MSFAKLHYSLMTQLLHLVPAISRLLNLIQKTLSKSTIHQILDRVLLQKATGVTGPLV